MKRLFQFLAVLTGLFILHSDAVAQDPYTFDIRVPLKKDNKKTPLRDTELYLILEIEHDKQNGRTVVYKEVHDTIWTNYDGFTSTDTGFWYWIWTPLSPFSWQTWNSHNFLIFLWRFSRTSTIEYDDDYYYYYY